MSKSIKNIVTTFLIGCVVFVLGSYFSTGFDFESVNRFLIYFGIYQLYTFVISYVNTLVFEFL